MNKLVRGLLCAVAILGAVIGGNALAGQKSVATMNVDTGAGQAWGAIGDIRNASDSVQYLDCGTIASPGSPPYVQCTGRDSSLHVFSCFSYDSTVVSAVQSLSSDSYVYLEWNTNNGEIAYIDISTGSSYTPKGP